MFAIIETQWHQYIVESGMEISVDLLSIEDWQVSYTFDNVLAIFDKDAENVKLWNPFVAGAVVECEITNSLKKDKKIRVMKFKNKTRYQRVIWFRAKKTVLRVKNIVFND